MTPKQNHKRNEELEKLINNAGTEWFDKTLKELHRWVEGEFPMREFELPSEKKSREKLLKLMEIEWVEKKLLLRKNK